MDADENHQNSGAFEHNLTSDQPADLVCAVVHVLCFVVHYLVYSDCHHNEQRPTVPVIHANQSFPCRNMFSFFMYLLFLQHKHVQEHSRTVGVTCFVTASLEKMNSGSTEPKQTKTKGVKILQNPKSNQTTD